MGRTVLRLALIAGPSYEPLYRELGAFARAADAEADIVFRGGHPELNRYVRDAFAAGADAFDLIATHTKYAPSQAAHLLPLDEAFAPEELADFSPALLELASIGGRLLSIPRNFDARLLYYRADRFAELGLRAPATWEELGAAARRASEAGYTGFVYPGKESGLFGTFFELLASGGGELFDDRLQPAFHGEAGVRALRMLKEWYRNGWTPRELPDMHYDEVSANFRSGDSTMVTDWPGYYALLADPACPVRDRFGLALTPAGASGKRAVYCGSHSFAVPKASRNRAAALALLKAMTSAEAQRIDAAHGHVPARRSLLERMKREAPAGSRDAGRWALLEETIATSVVIPPKFAEYPEAEDRLWMALRRCIAGDVAEERALAEAAGEIGALVARYARR